MKELSKEDWILAVTSGQTVLSCAEWLQTTRQAQMITITLSRLEWSRLLEKMAGFKTAGVDEITENAEKELKKQLNV